MHRNRERRERGVSCSGLWPCKCHVLLRACERPFPVGVWAEFGTGVRKGTHTGPPREGENVARAAPRSPAPCDLSLSPPFPFFLPFRLLPFLPYHV